LINNAGKLQAIAKEHPGKCIGVWFEDEARFGQHVAKPQGTLAGLWARRGCRPRAVKQTAYEWLYVLAAVCPATGESVGLLSPYVDNQLMSILLKQFSRQSRKGWLMPLAEDIHAVSIWDQAGFHKSKELFVPANISIIELPDYSPELNPFGYAQDRLC
jgi:hypothetical protein